MKTKHGFQASSFCLALVMAVATPAYGASHEETMHKQDAMDSAETEKQPNGMTHQADKEKNMKTAMQNAWLRGRLETAFLLNRHLNNFTITSKVEGDKAILTGKVESDIDKELAEQVALSVDGINAVDNQLIVAGMGMGMGMDMSEVPDKASSGERSFADRVEDATLTAEVKLKLLANSETKGLDINVDTKNGTVKLEGQVETEAEKDLAEKIAENVEGVKAVDNQLMVSP